MTCGATATGSAMAMKQRHREGRRPAPPEEHVYFIRRPPPPPIVQGVHLPQVHMCVSHALHYIYSTLQTLQTDYLAFVRRTLETTSLFLFRQLTNGRRFILFHGADSSTSLCVSFINSKAKNESRRHTRPPLQSSRARYASEVKVEAVAASRFVGGGEFPTRRRSTEYEYSSSPPFDQGLLQKTPTTVVATGRRRTTSGKGACEKARPRIRRQTLGWSLEEYF